MIRAFKIFGFGLLLFVITMILLFVMSMVTGSEQPIDFPWVGPAIAIAVAFCSLLFSRRLHPASTKQALTYGIVWAVMLAVILLVIAIPNGTTAIVFGNWSTYPVFIGVAIGPLLAKPKPAGSSEIHAPTQGA